MEMIMDYHLMFIGMAFFLLVLTILMLFVLETTKENIIAAWILSGLNMLICQINYLGFFGIGIIGYTTTGGITINLVPNMYPLFAFFILLYFINILFIYICWGKYANKVWEINAE